MTHDKRFLTEREAAEILRCSPSKVKRLRLGGKLAYIAGRPVLIDIDDLNSYIEAAKVREAAKEAPDTLEARRARGAQKAREVWIQRRVHAQIKGSGLS